MLAPPANTATFIFTGDKRGEIRMTAQPSLAPFQTKVARFWEGLKEQKFLGTRCKKCGEISFPPRAGCPRCVSSDTEWIELSGEGELLTYTVNAVSPESFCKFPSYIIGIVQLKEGVKVMAWLAGVKPEEVKIGMKLKVATKQMPDGKLSYEFRPI
jgi:uncharacterized OB-fold protein